MRHNRHDDWHASRIVTGLAVVFITLTLQAGAIASPDPAPSCRNEAQQLLNTLVPAASAIAGRQIRVDVTEDPAIQTQMIAGGGEAQYLLGTGQAGDQVAISRQFCTLDVDVQRVFLAHELGHGVDRIDVEAEYRNIVAPAWPARPAEISATARALEIYERTGLDVDAFAKIFRTKEFAQHLETARALNERRQRPLGTDNLK